MLLDSNLPQVLQYEVVVAKSGVGCWLDIMVAACMHVTVN